MRKRKHQIGICPYCFASGELTVDHVIPQCLFGDAPLPSDVPKAPVCQACNNALKSRDDIYLRDLLVNDPDSAAQPIVQELLPTYQRARNKNHSVYAREEARILYIPQFSPTGRITGITAQAKLDEARLHRI